MITEHRYDVVIVGAGGAGMRAAIEAGPRARTAVLTKLYPTRSHTGAAQGGMCAALANVEEDSWEWHAFDTVKGGDYLVDQTAAQIMCKEAIDAVIELEWFGLPFNRTPDGRIDQRRFGGHTRNHGEAPVKRACYAADRTGHMILQTLYQQCVKRNVRFFNEFYVLDQIMVDGACAGVVAYELATGELHVFRAKSVLYATGGYGRMFKVSSNAHYAMGGIPTNVEGQVVVGEDETPVPGLYAAGECACVSVHGANRLGTNSLLDIVVFGRRGGKHMARYAKDAELPDLDKGTEKDVETMLDGLMNRPEGANAADIRTE